MKIDFPPPLDRAINDLRYEMTHGQHADEIESLVDRLLLELRRFREELKRIG